MGFPHCGACKFSEVLTPCLEIYALEVVSQDRSHSHPSSITQKQESAASHNNIPTALIF